MTILFDRVDDPAQKLTDKVKTTRKAALAQFVTPSSIARFMAEMFPPEKGSDCRLLDAGAGTGALTCAFLDRLGSGQFGFGSVRVTACEIDTALHPELSRHLQAYQNVNIEIVGGDYITRSANGVAPSLGHTHAILNPPYKKIASHSEHRRALRRMGIETVNLYSAFVAIAVAQAAPGGQIVAIIPRSFCNGPYYRPFRDLILGRAAIRHIHLFESRNKAFKDDDVLQENVIIRLERGGSQGPVTISTSTDDSFSDLATREHPFDRIVFPDDGQHFIHVPTLIDKSTTPSSIIRHSLADLGINVSTGPVVDFRLKEHLREMPEPGTVPLLYPAHFSGNVTMWPQAGMKKPNAIQRNSETEKWLYPNAFYCVVRRFSSKEEKRRIVASVVAPSSFDGAAMLGFENHLNLFHENRRGLTKALAHGLNLFLNSTVVDDNFRRFSGHTQVNATDLKQMKYPSRPALIMLGEWAMQKGNLTQTLIDDRLGTLTA